MRGGALAAALLVMALGGCGGTGMDFDKAAWAAERGNYDGESRRGGMVGDLAKAGIVAGATRAAVREQLGEPDSTGPGADVYFLGRSATGPSFETWRIEYSPAGVVTAMRLERT